MEDKKLNSDGMEEARELTDEQLDAIAGGKRVAIAEGFGQGNCPPETAQVGKHDLILTLPKFV